MNVKISNAGLLLVMLAVLVVLSGLQAWQLNTLAWQFNTLITSLQSGSPVAASGSQGASPLAGLPTQVGGCG